MSDSHKQFTDEAIAAMMATQTAIVATICDLLIRNNAFKHEELLNDLHALLTRGYQSAPGSMGPLVHLLHLVEREGFASTNQEQTP